MKLSIKAADDQRHSPLIKAKIPVTVFNLPFTTSLSAADPSALSFSLATNFPSGPSLKFSTNTSSATTAAPPPLSVSLKSGTGLFGSPKNSPLLISAHFTLFPSPNPNPTFTLQIKPQFGDFSLLKTTFSNPNPKPNPIPKSKSISGSDLGEVENGLVPEEPLGWREVTMGSCSSKDGLHNPNHKPKSVFGSEVWKMESYSGKGGIFSGFAVTARTVLPVTKRVALNFRWGVNFPAEGTKLPFLTVDKVGIERVQEVKEVKKVKSGESDSGDVELLKGMCFWMKRDLEVLEKENREMKQTLEEIRSGLSAIKYGGDSNGSGKKTLLPSSGENSGDFERWRSKKSGEEEKGIRELKKSVNLASDVESELQRAIKAASS